MARANTKLFGLFDTVAENMVGSVMLCANDLVAIRAFTQLIQKGGLEVPSDFRLMYLGEMDDFGAITPDDVVTVITGAQVLATLKPEEGR